jgi:hypothetical protein
LPAIEWKIHLLHLEVPVLEQLKIKGSGKPLTKELLISNMKKTRLSVMVQTMELSQ